MSTKLNFTLTFDEDLDKYMTSTYPEVVGYRILSKSLDARNAPKGRKPKFHYIIEAINSAEKYSSHSEEFSDYSGLMTDKPIIIGAGPAGLFAALRLAEYGIASIVIERGDVATKRMLHISKYWKKGILDTDSNVCYGEGGAGLFSDGKLITRVKSSHIPYVMKKFVDYGAPEETQYISNPHLGSNKIRTIITKISDDLRSKGGEIIYNNRVDRILTDGTKVKGVVLKDGTKLYSSNIILATGHSAVEMYQHLQELEVAMQTKDFAVGVRIEHPRSTIDRIQHGQYCESELLGSARYRLSYHHEQTERGTYSFCMCPGGYVLSSGTDKDGIVVNGMSNYARNSPWSNSALVVSVKKGKDFDAGNVMAGLDFQHEIEKAAYKVSVEEADGRALPAMTVKELLDGKLSEQELPKTSSPSKIFKTDLKKIFPGFIIEHLKTALLKFDVNMPGFVSDDAVLIAPETRTSSPITILRDRVTLESTSHKGLYPCGEGAGYAGGITSAAVDGIKVAEQIIQKLVLANSN